MTQVVSRALTRRRFLEDSCAAAVLLGAAAAAVSEAAARAGRATDAPADDWGPYVGRWKRYAGNPILPEPGACPGPGSVIRSTAATTAAIGIVLIPAMIRAGFSPGSATSLQATAGSIGIIIPPSLPFVILGVISGISIGDLFLGGVLPGILLGLSLMAVAHLTAQVQQHAPSGQPIRLRNILAALGHSVLSLLTVVFVVGGILGGYVTPTEAAIVAVLWSFIVCFFFYR